ncbi:hypothetical protein Hanom_Chr10g00943491 [Helianthus anomalus]
MEVDKSKGSHDSSWDVNAPMQREKENDGIIPKTQENQSNKCVGQDPPFGSTFGSVNNRMGDLGPGGSLGFNIGKSYNFKVQQDEAEF